MDLNLTNPMAERKTKTVYRDGDKTIKLFVENYSKADILNEALNQARVEEGTDLSIPKLIAVTKVDNRWALVSEHIEGTPLDKLMEQNPDKEDEYLNRFVDIQLEILGHNVKILNRIKEKYNKRIDSLTNINDNVKYELLQRLDGMKNHTKLCHGDYNPSNIIIKEDGSHAIIDWAHVTQGNASADCAKTYLIFCMEGREEFATKYLNLFSEKSGIALHTIQRWLPIVAAAQLAKANDDEKAFLEKWIDIMDYE